VKILLAVRVLAHLFSKPNVVTSRPSELDGLHVDTLIELMNAIPEPDIYMQSVAFLSHDRMLKSYSTFSSARTEALALDLVRSQTSIPVPRMVKMFRTGVNLEGEAFCLMECIPGAAQLKFRWPTLSRWRKLKVILTMRDYLRQLRRVRSPAHAKTPGPLGPGPQYCNGLQFGDPDQMRIDRSFKYDTSIDLAAMFARCRKRVIALQSRYGRTPPAGGIKPSPAAHRFEPLVFTHNDLNMRNILIDDDEKLWIVDWAWSGFYPPWFEYLGMQFASRKDRDPQDWQNAIRFMAEPAFDIEDWLATIGIHWTPYLD
jgi:hypothetical protein